MGCGRNKMRIPGVGEDYRESTIICHLSCGPVIQLSYIKEKRGSEFISVSAVNRGDELVSRSATRPGHPDHVLDSQ